MHILETRKSWSNSCRRHSQETSKISIIICDSQKREWRLLFKEYNEGSKKWFGKIPVIVSLPQSLLHYQRPSIQKGEQIVQQRRESRVLNESFDQNFHIAAANLAPDFRNCQFHCCNFHSALQTKRLGRCRGQWL